MLDAINQEEEGSKDVADGRGLFVRELRKIAPLWNDQQISDACLNLLTAGGFYAVAAITDRRPRHDRPDHWLGLLPAFAASRMDAANSR